MSAVVRNESVCAATRYGVDSKCNLWKISTNPVGKWFSLVFRGFVQAVISRDEVQRDAACSCNPSASRVSIMCTCFLFFAQNDLKTVNPEDLNFRTLKIPTYIYDSNYIIRTRLKLHLTSETILNFIYERNTIPLQYVQCVHYYYFVVPL